jgi:hypothetical protein
VAGDHSLAQTRTGIALRKCAAVTGSAWLAILGLAWTLGAFAVMTPSAKALGRPGIGSLQRATTGKAVEKLKGLWGPGRVAAARTNTLWDFLLIPGYTILIIGVAGWISDGVAPVLGLDAALLGAAIIAVPVLAGLCDVVEDVISLQLLAKPATDVAARATSLLASAKWLLIGASAVWIFMVALPILLARP